MKVHEAIARAVSEERPGAVFTLMGNATMEFLASLRSVDGPAQYQGRIEGAVITMAEGYARSTGGLSVASVTSGPGLSNATNALVCAVRNRVPMVVITGHPDARSHQQYLHQEGLANLVGAGYVDVLSPTRALDATREAFYAAHTESRPVLLDIPRSVTNAEFPWDFDYTPSHVDLLTVPPAAPAPKSVESALAIVAASERPVLLAGRGAYGSGARSAILELAQEIGALLSTSLPVKNWFEEEPFDIGLSGLFCRNYTAEFFAEADCVIGVGASLNTHTIQGGYMFPEATVIHIDTSPYPLIGTGRTAHCNVTGDAKLSVEALTKAVRERGLRSDRYRTSEVRDRIARGKRDPDPTTFELEPGRADGRRLINVVDEIFPRECGLVISNGHCWGIAIPEFSRWRDPQLYAGSFGSIGMALPTAIGTAIGHPGKPVIHVEGDGGAMMNLHSFDTVRQYDLPIFSIIMNDASFGAEEHQMIAHGFAADLAYQAEVDFAAVASSLGCRSAVVTNEAEMRIAAKQFLDEPGPFVVDARVSRSVVSVPFRRLHYGIEA